MLASLKHRVEQDQAGCDIWSHDQRLQQAFQEQSMIEQISRSLFEQSALYQQFHYQRGVITI